jgi:hypothetical protein
MPKFCYDDAEARVYPDLAVEVKRGDVVTADVNPDPHRFSDATPAKAPKGSAGEGE